MAEVKANAHTNAVPTGLAQSSTNSDARRISKIRTTMSHTRDNVPQSAVTDTSHRTSLEDKPKRTHQRYVFSDPVAFSYLADDRSTTVLARRSTLEGYENYIVEQWACSRSHPTFIITSYTGDPSHKIQVNVLGVPTDQESWSPQLRMYDRALRKYHAREKSTPLGMLMVTNLSGFPSSLTVIQLPDEKLYKNKELFYVNENLKRLNCSGRAGLKLSTPTTATQAKFHQLYKTSEKIPLNASVIELVKLCQVALFLFGKIKSDYVDGLLCDITEQAVNDWWIEFGTEHYNIEPSDGILGPTTVAALLGMLMGARNRLHACSAPVSKDVFDLEATKRGIAYFQRAQRIDKTRRLDHQTLDRLRRVTAKAASGEGWAMPRAVKSTVAELSGKGGEMVMEMVGARDKAGIADIETANIDTFVDVVSGEHAKWLWHGKPRKTPGQDLFSRPLGEEGLRAHREEKRDSDDELENLQKRNSNLPDRDLSRIQTELDDEKDVSKRAVFRRATGLMTGDRMSLNRIKEAVGRRNHQSKLSREEQLYKPNDYDGARDVSEADLKTRVEDEIEPTFTKVMTETPPAEDSPASQLLPISVQPHRDNHPELGAAIARADGSGSRTPTVGSSVAGSVYQGIDLNDVLPVVDGPQDGIGPSLRRTQSATQYQTKVRRERHEGWWPRHMSFSLAEESVLTWELILTREQQEVPGSSDPRAAMSEEIMKATDARRVRAQLKYLAEDIGMWVEQKIEGVRELDSQAYHDQSKLEELYYPQLEEYHTLRQDTQDFVTNERLRLKEATADVEQLGDQLEYEIDQLKSQLEDVEDSVGEYERQVRDVENLVLELEEATSEREGWVHRLVRRITGLSQEPEAQADPGR